MPLTPQQVGERTADGMNLMARQSGLRLADIAAAFEEAMGSWRPPEYIIANTHFALAYRRAMRPPRQRVGGSGIRAIKRRAVRRPW